jgi:cytochrome b subunit of formate dehydrogenase
MTVRLKGTERDLVTIRWIPNYTAIERLGHWVHTATFVVPMTTGLFLYVPAFQRFVQGNGGYLSRLLHRGGAVAFMLVPILYLIFNPRGVFDSLKRIFTWGRETTEVASYCKDYWAEREDQRIDYLPPSSIILSAWGSAVRGETW